MNPASNPHLSLLNQALARYAAAVRRGDFIAAESHRKIYLSVFPLAFADVMQTDNGGDAHK